MPMKTHYKTSTMEEPICLIEPQHNPSSTDDKSKVTCVSCLEFIRCGKTPKRKNKTPKIHSSRGAGPLCLATGNPKLATVQSNLKVTCKNCIALMNQPLKSPHFGKRIKRDRTGSRNRANWY